MRTQHNIVISRRFLLYDIMWIYPTGRKESVMHPWLAQAGKWRLSRSLKGRTLSLRPARSSCPRSGCVPVEAHCPVLLERGDSLAATRILCQLSSSLRLLTARTTRSHRPLPLALDNHFARDAWKFIFPAVRTSQRQITPSICRSWKEASATWLSIPKGMHGR